MKINELLEGKGYYEIQVKDLVAAAGGEAQLKADFNGKSADSVYKHLLSVQRKLAKEKHEKYHEVGEVDTTDLMDWVDNRFSS